MSIHQFIPAQFYGRFFWWIGIREEDRPFLKQGT